MPVWLVKQLSTFTLRQFVNSTSAGSRMPVLRSTRPRIASLAKIFPGPVIPTFSESAAEISALYPLIQRPSQRTSVIGYAAISPEPCKLAPSSIRSSTLLRSNNAPVA